MFSSKVRAFFLGLALWLCAAGVAQAAISVTSVGRFDGPGNGTCTSGAFSFPSNSQLFVAIYGTSSQTSYTVTDSGSNAYTKVTNGTVGATATLAIYHTTSSSATSFSGSINISDGSGSSFFQCTVGYITGGLGLDIAVNTTYNNAAATSGSLVSGTPATAGDMVVAFLGIGSTGSGTFNQDTGNGWTSTFPTTSANTQGGTKLNAGSSAVTYAPSWTNLRAWAIVILTYKAAPSAASAARALMGVGK